MFSKDRATDVYRKAAGYLPVNNFLNVIFAALFFRITGLGSDFLKENASLTNLSMGTRAAAIIIVIYFFTYLIPSDKNRVSVALRKLSDKYFNLFLDISFFALAFILIYHFGTPNYKSILKEAGICLLFILASHHSYILVSGQDTSTALLLRYIDEKLGSRKLHDMFQHCGFYGSLGVFFFILAFALIIAINH